jgi:hypothetical protein
MNNFRRKPYELPTAGCASLSHPKALQLSPQTPFLIPCRGSIYRTLCGHNELRPYVGGMTRSTSLLSVSAQAGSPVLPVHGVGGGGVREGAGVCDPGSTGFQPVATPPSPHKSFQDSSSWSGGSPANNEKSVGWALPAVFPDSLARKTHYEKLFKTEVLTRHQDVTMAFMTTPRMVE